MGVGVGISRGPAHSDTVCRPCLPSHRCHWHVFPVRSKDIALGGGKCFLCMGKGYTTCTVCNGVGMVDKVRRGGTDTEGKWLGKEKEAMDPLTPQVERPKYHLTRLKTFSAALIAALEHAAAGARVRGCVGAVRMRGLNVCADVRYACAMCYGSTSPSSWSWTRQRDTCGVSAACP